MYPFIETIKVENGEVKNLRFHQARFERTRREMLGLSSHPALKDEIAIPASAQKGLFKCRILYDQKKIDLEYHPYVRPEIKSLKVISSDSITYPYKSADRSDLTKLYNLRGSCDDILILKNGMITDSYFANVALWDGFHWYTSEKPLLEGCMRAFLLEIGLLKTAPIGIADLSRFKSLKLINALNHLDEVSHIPLASVSW